MDGYTGVHDDFASRFVSETICVCFKQGRLISGSSFSFKTFFVSAGFVETHKESAFFFRGFFNQKRGSAAGTGFIRRFIPCRKTALRKTAATVKDFAAFGFPLDNFSAAILLRTSDACGLTPGCRVHGLGIFAIRISAACKKSSVFPALYHHLLAAFLTLFINIFLNSRLHSADSSAFVTDIISAVGTAHASTRSRSRGRLPRWNWSEPRQASSTPGNY